MQLCANINYITYMKTCTTTPHSLLPNSHTVEAAGNDTTFQQQNTHKPSLSNKWYLQMRKSKHRELVLLIQSLGKSS